MTNKYNFSSLLLNVLISSFNRSFSADIQTEHPDVLDYDVENLPHTYSPPFNPYRDSKTSI